MRSSVAYFLLALLAVAYVAQSEAAYCRTSAYKLPCKKVSELKGKIFRECKLKVTIGTITQHKNGCCTMVQRVASEATWETYKVCEEKSKNYPLLKRTKEICKALAKKGNC